MQAVQHCAFCGVRVSDAEPATERFGEPFCSEAHAEEFVREVRAARVQAAAAAVESPMPQATGRVVDDPVPARRTRRWLTWVCWGTPLLLLLSLPLLTSGGDVAAAAGSVLSVLALLACPLAMLVMMRGMGGTSHGGGAGQAGKDPAEKKDG